MTKTYDGQTARFIAAIVEAMPKDVSADVMQGWIENPNALRRALTDGLCPPKITGSFRTWKIVTVGTLEHAGNVRKRLQLAHVEIGELAGSMLQSVKFEKTISRLELVRVTTKELGLDGSVTIRQIFNKAHNEGLELCPDETALQLWLSYPDLLMESEELLFAMRQIIDAENDLSVFGLMRAGTRWVTSNYAHPNYRPAHNCNWVFVRKN